MLEALENLFQRLGGPAGDPIAMAVELVLIALAINWTVARLEGSRGTRPLRRLLLILLVVTLVTRVLSDRFGWERFEILYQYFVLAVAFIVLVAFQPELRRAFIRVGDIGPSRRQTVKARLINALVKSAGFLSRNKYGALIAIQRGVDLRGWAENGTTINSEVSASLLNTIFFPNSPLHDLGTIIADNRVLAANCQFPSAESEEIDTNLGSRHLAAVGLSYETDALILIVSEETGTISLADNGKLTRYLSLDDLEHELEERLGGTTAAEVRRQKSGWSLSWYGLRRALLVAVLSLMIWYLADQATQVNFDNVPVVMRIQQPAGFVVDVEAPDPPRFTVKLRGSNRAMDALRRELGRGPSEALIVEWTLPASLQTPGNPNLPVAEQLEEVNLFSSWGVEVLDAQPDVLALAVDRETTEDLPLVLDAGSFLTSDVQITPPTVAVTLPRRVFEQLPPDERVIAVPVAGRLAGQPTERSLSLEDVPVQMTLADQPVGIEPRTVDVVLTVVAATRELAIENVRVRLAFTPTAWQQYDQRRVRLVLRDPLEWFLRDLKVRTDDRSVTELTDADVDAYVLVTSDLLSSVGTEHTLDVNFDLPRGLSLVSPPPQVHIRLEQVAPQ
jgi:diadenylate cyclase